MTLARVLLSCTLLLRINPLTTIISIIYTFPVDDEALEVLYLCGVQNSSMTSIDGCSSDPFAAAEGEWIKDDQQGELFEALVS